VLDRVDAAAFARLSEPSRNRLRLRRAGVWAALAHARSRDGGDAAAAARRAIDELAAVNKTELGDEEQADYVDAAIRTGASRFAAATAPTRKAAISLALQPGEPGQTCLLLTDTRHGAQAPLLRRCTYATVWPGSVRVAPDGRSVALAVQPLPAWTELWLLRATPEGWQLQVLPPAVTSSSPAGCQVGRNCWWRAKPAAKGAGAAASKCCRWTRWPPRSRPRRRSGWPCSRSGRIRCGRARP
jgi:hypothetical protein